MKPSVADLGRVLSEVDLQKTCTEFLALDGWIGLKTDPVSRREWGKGFGELGMADYQYRRYSTGAGRWPVQESGRVSAQLMWIEWKAPRGKAAAHQRQWIERERSRGALVLLAGEDFDATPEGFFKFYRQSGLMRKNVTMGSH